MQVLQIWIQDALASVSAVPPILVLVAVAGISVALFGLGGGGAGDGAVRRRLRGKTVSKDRVKLAQDAAAAPSGFMKAFVPAGREQRSRIRRELAQAGFVGSNAVQTWFLLRGLGGVVAPLIVVVAMGANAASLLPPALSEPLSGVGQTEALVILSALILVGFFGPSAWLRGRLATRRRMIEEGFPNTLDLMQVAVEAGLGFDAAMSKVASEMRGACLPIAEEFAYAQREIAAGRDRDSALLEMGRRMGVEEVSSFASVVVQSAQFGTSIAEALTTFSTEMRHRRELKAQETANKLPVKMSLVLSVLMLPTLFLIALAPTGIQFMRSGM